MAKPDRQERLAKQLRANLKKRKAQMRARNADASMSLEQKQDDELASGQSDEASLPDAGQSRDD